MTEYKMIEVDGITIGVPTGDLLGGYTREALEAAFKLVKPAKHWKAPIDAVIPESEEAVVLEAISFFTATEGTTWATCEPGKLRVTAPGYWAGPAN